MLKSPDLRLVPPSTIIDPRNGTESPETDSYISGHLIDDGGDTAQQ